MKKARPRKGLGRIFPGWQASCCGLLLAGGLACASLPVVAQEPQREKVTLSVRGVSVLQALQELNRRYDNRVIFKKEEVEKARASVSVDLNSASLLAVVQACIKDTHLQAVSRGNVVVVGPKTERRDAPQRKKTVRGLVNDAAGNPLPGATVLLKGTSIGTATDIDGRYSLVVPEGDHTLVFTMVGMKSKEVQVGKRSDINVTLEENVELMDEVVVTGYQTISKERATGSFAKVTAKDLETQRLTSVNSMLEGRVAGYSDGQIRGVNTMNGVTTPLYVIDGFPVEKTLSDGMGGWVENVPDINMEDIESITVLKDAAATSIYGARAANGVVVITTKRAKKDQLNVSFSATLTVQPYDYYTGHLADAATLIGLEREWAAQNLNFRNGTPEAIRTYAQQQLDNCLYQTNGIRNILNYYAGHQTEQEMNAALDELASRGFQYYRDVEKYGKRNPFTQQYNLSIGKGSERNTFNASITYTNNRLEDKQSDNQSFGISLQNSTVLADWLSVDVGAYLDYGSGTTQTYSLLSPGYVYSPYDRLTNADGTPYTDPASNRINPAVLDIIYEGRGLQNVDITPLDEMKMSLRDNRDFDSRVYARLNFKFTDWLRYTVSYQYEWGEYKTSWLRDKESYYVRNRVNAFASVGADGKSIFNMPYGNIYTTDNNAVHAYNFRQQLDFNKTFGGVHDVTALLGMEIRENKSNYNSSTLYDYDPLLLTYTLVDAFVLSNGPGAYNPYGESFTQYDMAYVTELLNRYVSAYANAAYTYDSRYTVTGSIRWDRTNLFATGSKYQKRPIWSTGLAWNVDKEEFFDADWVNMLKLRLSYGIGGNIAKNSAPYMTALYSTNYNLNGVTQGVIKNRPNPNLRWEKTTTFNVGIDFSILQNCLSGTIEYYDKRSSDLLSNVYGVPTEGWGTKENFQNNGNMTNRGFELTLSGDIIRNKDWYWNVSGVLGYNKNKVTHTDAKAPTADIARDYPTAYPRVGNPLNAIYGYRWAGLSSEGTPQVYDAEGNIWADMEPTEVEDLVYLGTSIPIYNGSVSTNLRWRNWELAAQFLFEGGHKMFDSNVPVYAAGSGAVSASIKNRWQQPGDEAHTDIPRYISAENPDYNAAYSSMYSRSSALLLNATNVRLNNLSLTYRIPSDICHKFFLQNARIMLGMENVFTIAKNSRAKYMLGGYTKPNYLCGIYLNF